MGAGDILTALWQNGLTVTTDGKNIGIEPKSKLTDEVRSLIRNNKPDLLAFLNMDRGASNESTPIQSHRRCVFCRDCHHYIASPTVDRPHGVPREAPGGCRQGRTSPDWWPPIYPFTGWHCDGWAASEAFKDG